MISNGLLVQTTKEITRLQLRLKVRLNRLRLFWPAWMTRLHLPSLKTCAFRAPPAMWPWPCLLFDSLSMMVVLGCRSSLQWPCRTASCCLGGCHFPSTAVGPHPSSLPSRPGSSCLFGTWHLSSPALSGPSSSHPSYHATLLMNTSLLPFPYWKIWPAWQPAWRCGPLGSLGRSTLTRPSIDPLVCTD